MEDYACLDMVVFCGVFFCVIVSIIVNGFFFLLMQKENSLLINMLTLTVCSSVGLLLFITKFNELQ